MIELRLFVEDITFKTLYIYIRTLYINETRKRRFQTLSILQIIYNSRLAHVKGLKCKIILNNITKITRKIN